MPTFEIICLASSDKKRGRCVAGLKTDGSGWLRPVSEQSDGTLYSENYTLDTNQEPQIFDILEIECLEHRLECHQPENWVISGKKWRLIGFPNRQKLVEILKPELDRNSTSQTLLGNLSDRVEYEWLQQNPAQHSLAYVKPENINWIVREYLGSKRYRASFTLNHAFYDLRITDPGWKFRMENAQLPTGDYSSAEVISRLNLVDFNWRSEGFRFTVSLGAPFIPSRSEQQYCFKLIAAVINTAPIANPGN